MGRENLRLNYVMIEIAVPNLGLFYFWVQITFSICIWDLWKHKVSFLVKKLLILHKCKNKHFMYVIIFLRHTVFFCTGGLVEWDGLLKRYFIIDQQITRHFVHYGECLYLPFPIYATKKINSYLTLRISAHHDER